MKLLLTFVLLNLVFCLSTFARVDGGHVGGGDYKSEGRIKSIRDNIYEWILAGNARGLKFRDGMVYETYSERMKEVLAPELGNVIVNVIKTSEEDDTLNTLVNGVPKTCKWFLSKVNQRHILCNFERFWEHSESEQYRLIHHEYAGLAGLEMSVGEDSDYYYSNQITKNLKYERSLRLPVITSSEFSTQFVCGFSIRGGGYTSKYYGKYDIDVNANEETVIDLGEGYEFRKVNFKIEKDYMYVSLLTNEETHEMTIYGYSIDGDYYYGAFQDRKTGKTYVAFCNAKID